MGNPLIAAALRASHATPDAILAMMPQRTVDRTWWPISGRPSTPTARPPRHTGLAMTSTNTSSPNSTIVDA